MSFLANLMGVNLNEPTEFQYPFKRDKIQQVNMAIQKNMDGSWYCSARVHYQAGGTGGFQEFINRDFNSLLRDIDKFINSMPG